MVLVFVLVSVNDGSAFLAVVEVGIGVFGFVYGTLALIVWALHLCFHTLLKRVYSSGSRSKHGQALQSGRSISSFKAQQ